MISPNQLAEEAAIDDKDSKLTTDKDGLLMRWARNCGDMYNSELDTDGSILQTNRSSNESEDSPPLLKGSRSSSKNRQVAWNGRHPL